MTSPLKITREKKLKIIEELNRKSFELATFNKGCLDSMDFRLLTKLSKLLNELYEKAKPYQNEI